MSIIIDDLVHRLPIGWLLRNKFNNGNNQQGCTQPIVLSDEAWESVMRGDTVDIDEDDISLGWHSQNEFYQSEPDEVIGYLPTYTVYDLLDCCGDWQSEIDANSEEVVGLISIDEDGYEIEDEHGLLDYILDNWDTDIFYDGIREDIREFLTQKWS